MHLREKYLAIIEREGLINDLQQLAVVERFDALGSALTPRTYWYNRLFRPSPKPVKGIYLWGGVGHGKTWLMDLFYDALPGDAKLRLHFHRFMQRVHQEMNKLKGWPDPLVLVSRRLLKDVRVLCLDEFSVTDIGDAMLLAGLLEAMFEQGVVLVTTANLPPDQLYRDGIQRSSFLPAIGLLKHHCQVVELNGGHDYRKRLLESSLLFYTPLGTEADLRLECEFSRLAATEIDSDGVLTILGRGIPYHRRSGGLIWFDFETLCGPPRSRHDYIEVGRAFHTVFISDIPQLDSACDDRARRFIDCIDEFYDRRVKVVLSAATPMEDLYHGTRLRFEFERTASRLQEMQTSVYLGRSHKG